MEVFGATIIHLNRICSIPTLAVPEIVFRSDKSPLSISTASRSFALFFLHRRRGLTILPY